MVAGAAGAVVDVAAAGKLDGTTSPGTVGLAGAVTAGALFMTLLLALPLFKKKPIAKVLAKKMPAAHAVDFDKKFDEPVAPNTLPDAPLPNAAPISAPLPCCIRTKPITARADKICTT